MARKGRMTVIVVPTKAGTQWLGKFVERRWAPAFAGATCRRRLLPVAEYVL
jgi:hypothetical protein